jgi:uncharacterized protein (TIGR02246 family)
MLTQEKDIANPQLRQEIDALVKEFDQAKNNNDAVAVAALFTDDAILVTDSGPIYGREAIEKYHTDLFQNLHFSNHLGKADPNSVRALDTAGNEVWTNGEWSNTIQGKDFGPIQLKGYWSAIQVREDGAWKDRMQTWNITPASP